ncbi:MAG: DNA polymerase Y family protein [bacterium]
MACVSVAAFPLQLLLRRHPGWAELPAAVVSEDKPQGEILWVNRAARSGGILPGQRYAVGLALVPGLRAGEISNDEVRDARTRILECLWRFTPDVETAPEEGVFWLGATGLERLHPSLERWARALREELSRTLALRAVVVVGFSRFGTYAVARSRRENQVFASEVEERAAAGEVALRLLDLDPELRDLLAKLGITTVAGFLSLPAGDLLARFDERAHRLHRLATGELAPPLQPIAYVEPLIERLVLDDPESDHTRLLFGVKRMLHPLLAALVRRAWVLAALHVRLVLDRRQGTHTAELRPAVPTLEVTEILDLVRLRLESMTLAAGVAEIELEADGVPATKEQLGLFTIQPRRDLAAANRALARLRAEIGEQAVVRAVLRAGHLPEASFAWEPIDSVRAPRAIAVSRLPRPLVRHVYAKPVPLPAVPRALRDDGWLVRGPSHGAVTKLVGPHILSGGWWIREIHREYLFALTTRGALLWVFYDRRRRRFFLHGEVS